MSEQSVLMGRFAKVAQAADALEALRQLGVPDDDVEVISGTRVVGTQKVLLTGPTAILKVTAFRRNPTLLENHFKRFLRHTHVEAIQWVNITRRQLAFRTLRRSP